MKTFKPKIALFLLFLISILFFSNDFGLIDIEKTAIITAIAIDKAEDGDYLVTCQIAVPEATGAVSENQKAQMSGKGSTVGGAIKTMGSLSGWFPQTIFCNLIIVGNDLIDQDVIGVLDYFSKTMRVQDSAQVVLAEKKAKDLLSVSTPLDNISSFAIQKILLKNPGFDQDVCPVDIKTFCVGYYGESKSSYMPLVKIISAEDPEKSGDSSGGGSGSGGSGSEQSSESQGDTKTKGTNAFDATTTALFVKGKKVGELDKTLTHTFNMITKKINGTAFSIDDVDGVNYLVTVKTDDSMTCVKADQNQLSVNIDINLYCQVSDQTKVGNSSVFESNDVMSEKLIAIAETRIAQNVEELFAVIRQTGCDFLGIKEKLYRFNHKQYSRYKDNYLQVMDTRVNVKLQGQS
ncbi:MAG: hypothetical protein IKB98_02260 [Clostridia bacterium]|nr:hypothetical protein [Clostridia bacterium]